MIEKNLRPYLYFNLILLVSFSVSINSFVEIKFVNYFFYIFFHLTFIYFLFYHYHFFIYVLAFCYGILLDIILLNEISAHLVSFIMLVSLYVLLKRYLFLFSAYKMSITIFTTLITTLFLEVIFAFLFNNIIFNISQIIMYIVISVVIFFPSIFLFSKLDK